ncbi:ABC transporter permease [Cohaesibacter celericrescens]|uniref:ABC transporter permease n=1 Tax=Cohaesibacter celericrescens TaxID=2067669 RepID=A0A2N5XQ25_9HYPH|nr:ABC transporter permease [Cohaesibacter celericrescens]PLW76621.1 ABC transporter permease [Cohaesibacter celericrescens]
MYYLRLLGQYALTLLVALSINFFLPRIAPGDPLDYLLSEDTLRAMTQTDRLRVLSDFGLDLPLPMQFFNYLVGILHGDFGLSTQLGQPVWDILMGRLPWTLLLTGGALLFSTLIGSILGVLSAWRRGEFSDIATLSSVLLVGSLPPFWLAMLLIILFSTTLQWLPSFGAYELGAPSGSWDWYVGIAKRMVMPVLALGLVQLASVLLIARSSMLVALEQDFIMFARSKGLSERIIFFKHAFRNAILPLYTNAMLGIGSLVGGALVIETVFSYPGLGSLIVSGVGARDYNLLQGIFVMTTISVIAANLITDLFYSLIDPRTRKSG